MSDLTSAARSPSPGAAPPPAAESGAAAEPGLADLLKEATAEDHRAAEGHPLQQSLVNGTVSRESFVAFQSRVLRLLRELAPRLAGEGEDWGAFRAALSGHEARLAADLEGLGRSSNGVRPPAPSAALDEFFRALDEGPMPEGALGAFYVIEGSMNGNRFIRRALAGRRPDWAEYLTYFDPYGEEQRERWMGFREAISRVGATLDSPAPTLSAARATFRLIGQLADESSSE